MSEQDDRLENFIRKGLGQPEFAFREEDWALMESKLSAIPVPVSIWAKLRWWVLGAALFMISFFSGWVVKGYLDRENTSSNKSAVIENEAIASPSKPAPTEASMPQEKEQASQAESMRPTILDPVTSPIQNTNSSKNAIVVSDFQKETGSQNVAPAKQLTGIALSDGPNDAYLQYLPWSLKGLSAKLPFAPITPDESKPLTIIKQDDKKKASLPFKAAFGLMLSPDYTGTSVAKGFETMGETYGLGLEYYTGERFRIKLAALKSRKIYSAGKGEYSFPGSYGYTPPQPEKTDATCDVLEIPILIQYSLWSQGKNKIWLSNGLSSYWMQREEYHYTYKTAGSYPDNVVIEKENRHLLSVFSIGLPYERHLNKRLSLELEPYLKIPLGGVGYGKVKLYTTGAYFSIKYHFGK